MFVYILQQRSNTNCMTEKSHISYSYRTNRSHTGIMQEDIKLIICTVSNTISTVSNTLSTVSNTISTVSNTISTVSNTISKCENAHCFHTNIIFTFFFKPPLLLTPVRVWHVSIRGHLLVQLGTRNFRINLWPLVVLEFLTYRNFILTNQGFQFINRCVFLN